MESGVEERYLETDRLHKKIVKVLKGKVNKEEIKIVLDSINELMSHVQAITEAVKDNICIGKIGESVMRIEKEMKMMNKRKTEEVSYAAMARKKNTKGTIIVPKKLQETSKTKEDCMNSIKPNELKIGIQGVKKISRGGIIVTCENEDDNKKLIKEIEKKLGTKYEIKKGELRNPRIKIIDMTEELSEDKLISCLLNQNNGIIKESNIKKVLKIWRSGRSNKYNAIIEVEPEAFHSILERRKLNIIWNECRVFEEFSVFRCFKCLGYNHKAQECTNNLTCIKCGSNDHKVDKCDNNNSVRCSNCINCNTKMNMKLDTNHSPMDSSCSVFKRQLELARNKTRYDK